VVKYCY